MSDSKRYTGSQVSKDVRPATAVAQVKSVPPGFANSDEWEGFKQSIKRAHENGLLPKSLDTVEKAIVVGLKGRELGLDPLYALSVLYIVNGVAQLEGEGMLGLVFKKYPKAQIKWLEQTHAKASFSIAREGGEPSVFTFTVQDALRANLIQKINPDGTVTASAGKAVWVQYTRNMLMWRAVAMGVRYMFPECIQGIMTPDEAQSPISTPTETISAADVDTAFAPEAEIAKLHAAEKAIDVAVEKIADQQPVPEPTVAAPVEETTAAFEPLPFERPTAKDDGQYMIRFGSLMGKRLCEIPGQDLKVYLHQIQAKNTQANGTDVQLRELVDKITAYLKG